MSNANRDEAQTEMKKVIQQAFNSQSLWTTDWANLKLQALEPKVQAFSLKRKLEATPIPSASPKKAKNTHIDSKPKLSKSNVFDAPYDPDAAAKARRAQRFEREHTIERQRTNGSNGSYGSGTGQLYANGSKPSSLADRVGGISLGFVPSKVQQKWNGKTASRRSMYGRFQSDDNGDGSDANAMDWDTYKIVGRSEEVFKQYLRLTSEPDAATIRPKHVLEKTLAELKIRWRREQNYTWVCGQFKSLRQDLTVQRIKDDFTVTVYEIHARIALENDDMVEFNSCIATLTQLYELGIKGKNDEFLAYRILYLVHAKNRSEINRLIGQLSLAQKSAPSVAHALQVQRAVATNNYHAMFVLYNAPAEVINMGAYIMDAFVVRQRVIALMCMSVYRPSLSLQFITSELSFESLEEAHKFLVEHNAHLYTDRNPRLPLEERGLDTKAALPVLTRELQQKYRKVGVKGVV
ncbi:SAC3/GANP/Nin1/mts3/eIF-3 p25 family-domain-containing protein [Auriculariales sp. MPI-PUGE-AT-0066]|nr:SAC3/GANP/Nin1/mts3/eIF-3 p25 family-domain-containing protein [Auriculariales sp. MPI-PUGE-AT-0066]